MTPDIVIVTWNDAHGSTADYYSDKRHAPAVMHTIGWLMEANRIGVSVCNERSPDGDTFDYRGHTFIPLEMLVSVQRLTPKGGRVIRKSGQS